MIFYLLVICIFPVDAVWHSYTFDTGYNNREESYILEAKSDHNFHVGHNVSRWISTNTAKWSYAIGISPECLTVIKFTASKGNAAFSFSNNTVCFNFSVADVVAFKHWNATLRKPEIIISVAVVKPYYALEWYRISSELNMENIWTWNLNKKPIHLNYFVQEYKNKLLVITDFGDKSTADIYEFLINRNGKDFWLNQHLPLANPINNSAINTLGPDYYLSIPQPSLNLILVYKLKYDHFVPYKNITCQAAQFIVSFQMSFQSYIVVAGLNGGIFQFKKTGIEKIDVVNSTLEDVRFWHIIPVNNYRDEVILLAQKELDHDTHSSPSLDVITHSKNQFVLHEDFSCIFHGEQANGLRCIADEERHEGIIGLTTIFLDNLVGILVPRHDSPSGLILLNITTELLPDPVDLEIEKIFESRKKLEQIIQSRSLPKKNPALEARYDARKVNPQAASAFKEIPVPEVDTNLEKLAEIEDRLYQMKQKISDMQNLLSLYLESKDSNDFKNIIFKGVVQVDGEAQFEESQIKNVNGEPFDAINADLVKLNENRPIESPKTFTNIEVHELQVKSVNGIPVKSIAFATDELELTGNWLFTEEVDVSGSVKTTSGLVNEFVLEDEVVTTGHKIDDVLTFHNLTLKEYVGANTVNKMPLQFHYSSTTVPFNNGDILEKLELPHLYIPENLTVQNVNDEDFQSFLNSLCMRNIETYIPGEVDIIGDVAVTGDTHINYLNGLMFPDEYMFSNDGQDILTGKKVFTRTLNANEITTEGTINGIKSTSLITLSTNQTLPGMITFNDLVVEIGIDVGGNVIGPHVKNFLENPTLLQSRDLIGNINFNDLEVDGDVIVTNSFNNTPFATLLAEIVYRDEPDQTINAAKEFPKGLQVKDLEIVSGNINDVPIDHFFTTTTEQSLTVPVLKNNVTFNHLHVTGTYGGFNLTEFDQAIVKLSGDQFVSSRLTFEESPVAEQLEITSTLNNIPVGSFLFRDGDRAIDGHIEFKDIVIDKLEVEGNSFGHIRDFDIEEFDQRRLSISKDQRIEAPFTALDVRTKDLKADRINGTDYDEVFGGEDHKIEKLLSLIQSGQIRVKDMTVNGSINIEKIDGTDMQAIYDKATIQGKLQDPSTEVIFENVLNVGHLNTVNLSGMNFNDFLDHIVYRHEQDVEFSGIKCYENAVINKYIDTEEINNIPIRNLLTKTGRQTISGPINIVGDVNIVSKTDISGRLNDVPLPSLKNLYSVSNGKYTIHGDVTFHRLVDVLELETSRINNFYVTDLLNNIVYKDKGATLIGNTIFEKPVKIKGNLAIERLINGVDLEAYLSDAVLISSDQVIDGIVEFLEPVSIEDRLSLSGNLQAPEVLGYKVKDWLENAMFINKGIIEGHFTLERAEVGEKLLVKNVNDIPMCTLIPLREDQVINQTLQFENLLSYGDISVGNIVNGYKLAEEVENTLLADLDQVIASDFMFNEEVRVKGNISIDGRVNEVSLKMFVTTDTEQELTNSYNFTGNVQVNDVEAHGFVGDVNITDWMARSVKKLSPLPQNINETWTVSGNLRFIQDVRGTGDLNGFNVVGMAKELEERKKQKYIVEKNILRDYEEACEDVNYLIRNTKKQIYEFKYFETVQILQLNLPILITYQFRHKGNSYLLLREESNCLSHLLLWEDGEFKLKHAFEFGLVCEVISARKDDDFYFVTRTCPSPLQCLVTGTNVWSFNGDGVEHLYTIEDLQQMHESRVPGTFYGIAEEEVVEYTFGRSALGPTINKYRAWKMETEHLEFVPRELGFGLAVKRQGNVYKLLRKASVFEDTFGYDTKSTIVGEYVKDDVKLTQNISDIHVMHVGHPKSGKRLTAVASHEESWIKSSPDLIKIYDDLNEDKLYQNIPSYKPSSLVSIEFGNGETILAFFEDQTTLELYEYKGIAGFQHRNSARVPGSKLFTFSTKDKENLLGVVDKEKITIMKAIMSGNKLDQEELDCEL